jgi:MoxR-like ATPase
MAKAAAYLRGRDYVVPQDVQFVYPKTVEHRLLLAPEARTPDAGAALLKQIAARVPAPRV